MNGWLRMISNFNHINTHRYSFVVIILFLFFYTPLMAAPTTIIFEGGNRIDPTSNPLSPEVMAGLLENETIRLSMTIDDDTLGIWFAPGAYLYEDPSGIIEITGLSSGETVIYDGGASLFIHPGNREMIGINTAQSGASATVSPTIPDNIDYTDATASLSLTNPDILANVIPDLIGTYIQVNEQWDGYTEFYNPSSGHTYIGSIIEMIPSSSYTISLGTSTPINPPDPINPIPAPGALALVIIGFACFTGYSKGRIKKD